MRDEGDRLILLEREVGPQDPTLTIVLAVFNEKFVTWVYNRESRGYCYGHYFEPTAEGLSKATDDYLTRRI